MVQTAEKICSSMPDQLTIILDAAAAAAAKRGWYATAVEAERQALERAQAVGRTKEAADYAQRLEVYKTLQ
jgi:hypothetical protein